MTLPDIQRLRTGDETAWMVVYEWLWPKSLAVAKRKLHYSASRDAEDVASIALQQLVGQVEKVDSTEDLLPLILAITHNQAVQRIRYNKAEKRDITATDSLDQHDVPLETSPLSNLELTELRALIQQLQQSLSPKAARILSDFYLAELTHREIAERHGLAVNSIGVNLTRSLQRIREVMKKKPELMKEIQGSLRSRK